ncbi:MAG: serine/threonine protein kinase [Planctomycetota bacterium]|nr:MAG: serine/threonine protein kinase [Planctomycetota bacterium]
MLDTKRRLEIERLLLLRGRLLAPRRETIQRALRRCVKHTEHSGAPDDESELFDEAASSTAGTTDTLAPSSTGALPSGEIQAPLNASPSEEMRIASGVAQAITVTDEKPDADLDVGSLPGGDGKLIPAVIKRGERSIKGLASGSVIKGYRIEQILGVGGMGQVYRAMQMSMNRRVAFKILNPRLGKNTSFRERFLREARMAGRLQHPNLIAVHDVDEHQGLIFFSMELVQGETVKELIAKHGKLGEEEALRIIRGCLEGLVYAHGRGLIHRDIKPDNIMVSRTGQVKIADLGLSRLDSNQEDGAASGETASGILMGTPYYMAPEQSRDAHGVDARADLYAVGATLFHMVHGKVPFSGNSSMDVLVRAATQPLVFPEGGCSLRLRTIITSLMEKDPANRPADAAAVLSLIHGGLSHLSSAGDDLAAVSARRLRPSRGRGSWLLALILALLLVGGGMLAFQSIEHQRRWSLQQEQVDRLLAQHRYHQALRDLDGFLREARPSQRGDVQALRSQVNERWDEHVQTTYSVFIARIDDLIWEQRYDEAASEMERFASDPAKMSPWMRLRLDEARRTIGRVQSAEEK